MTILDKKVVFCTVVRDENNKKKVTFLENWKTEAKVRSREEIMHHMETVPHAAVALVTGEENGVTVIDFDEKNSRLYNELFITCPTYAVSTPNGTHLYYKYNKNLLTGAGRYGAKVDVRNDGGVVFCPPTPGYERYENDLAELSQEALDILSKYQTGSTGLTRREDSLKNTETRNDALFRRACAWANSYDKNTVYRKMFEANATFTKGALEEKELEAIFNQVYAYAETRPDTTKEEREQAKDNREKDKEERAREYAMFYRTFINTHNPLAVDELGRLYQYRGGIYTIISDVELSRMIVQDMEALGIESSATNSKIKDTMTRIRGVVPVIGRDIPFAPTTAITFENGYYNVSDGTFCDYSQDIVFLNKNNVRFDIGAQCPRWIRFVGEISAWDKETITLMQEFFGYSMTTDVKQGKMLVLRGNGANGKSIFGRILRNVVGYSSSITTTLEAPGEDFGLECFYGKRLAVIDEAKTSQFIETDAIKRLITGEEVTAKIKFKENHVFSPYAKLLLLTNNIPKLDDTTEGLYRRILLVNLKVSFAGVEDFGLEDTLMSELPGIAQWGLEGLKSLMKRGRFNIGVKTRKNISELKQSNSPVTRFLAEQTHIDGDGTMLLSEVYAHYSFWCEKNGYKRKSSGSFKDDLIGHGERVKHCRSEASPTGRAWMVMGRVMNTV